MIQSIPVFQSDAKVHFQLQFHEIRTFFVQLWLKSVFLIFKSIKANRRCAIAVENIGLQPAKQWIRMNISGCWRKALFYDINSLVSVHTTVFTETSKYSTKCRKQWNWEFPEKSKWRSPPSPRATFQPRRQRLLLRPLQLSQRRHPPLQKLSR